MKIYRQQKTQKTFLFHLLWGRQLLCQDDYAHSMMARVPSFPNGLKVCGYFTNTNFSLRWMGLNAYCSHKFYAAAYCLLIIWLKKLFNITFFFIGMDGYHSTTSYSVPNTPLNIKSKHYLGMFFLSRPKCNITNHSTESLAKNTGPRQHKIL